MTAHDRDAEPGEPGIVGPDHYSLTPLPWLAGSSDVGHRHEINQDALSLAGRDDERGQVAVLAISDGVSTSLGSERSAAVAVQVTTSTLVSLLRQDGTPSEEQVQATMADAFAAALDAVLSTHGEDSEAGSCTLVAGVLWNDRIVVGNVGDCRAYWVGDDGSAQVLSVDDSVAQARIDLGMSREEAEAGPQAHAITRWLGPEASDVSPRQVLLPAPGDGWLLLCSDGLWNYCSAPEQMQGLVLEAAARCQGDVAATAQLLVDWANGQGGRDNITVALARVLPSGPNDPAALA